MKTKVTALLCLLGIALWYPVTKATAVKAGAGPCVVGRTAPASGFWTWPAGSHVNIYLREPDFSAVDVAAVRVAAEKWDQSATENGSNVRFDVQGLTREMRTAQNDMTLIRGDVYDKRLRHLAMLQAHSLKEDQLIDYALVIVDRSVSSTEVLTNVMAHELGHTLGLLDCFKCSSGATAMGLMKGGGESNGIEGPTACDKAGVGTAYRELMARVRPAPSLQAMNTPVVDEGEEPEADDTPVVRRP